MKPLAALALLVAGCAPHLPGPPIGPHQGDAPVAVPYPPPVPHPLEIPAQPDDESVWIDPHWAWTGGGYRWIAGGWVHPPPGAYYAPPTLVRLRNGQLMVYPGHWHGGEASRGDEPGTDDEGATGAR
jgi:hypothetical protein